MPSRLAPVFARACAPSRRRLLHSRQHNRQLSDLLHKLTHKLGLDQARVELRWLQQYLGDRSTPHLNATNDNVLFTPTCRNQPLLDPVLLPDNYLSHLSDLVDRRLRGEPLQYILGKSISSQDENDDEKTLSHPFLKKRFQVHNRSDHCHSSSDLQLSYPDQKQKNGLYASLHCYRQQRKGHHQNLLLQIQLNYSIYVPVRVVSLCSCVTSSLQVTSEPSVSMFHLKLSTSLMKTLCALRYKHLHLLAITTVTSTTSTTMI